MPTKWASLQLLPTQWPWLSVVLGPVALEASLPRPPGPCWNPAVSAMRQTVGVIGAREGPLGGTVPTEAQQALPCALSESGCEEEPCPQQALALGARVLASSPSAAKSISIGDRQPRPQQLVTAALGGPEHPQAPC